MRFSRFLGRGCRLLGAAVVLCASPAAAGPIRTLLVGDSITFGVVSAPEGPSWAELVAFELAGSHDVVNVAQSGTSAVYWAPSTPCPGICSEADNLFDDRATPELPADVATLLLGTNDAVGLFLDEPTGTDDWEGYMREVLDGLFDGGVAAVLLMSSPDANLSPDAAARIGSYRERVDAICGDVAGVVCGPDLATLLDPTLDFAPGDVHPNASGHAKIADAVVASLREIPEPATGSLLLLGLAAGSLAGAPASGKRRFPWTQAPQ
jgi:lysophospholipase L1-like esterase